MLHNPNGLKTRRKSNGTLVKIDTNSNENLKEIQRKFIGKQTEFRRTSQHNENQHEINWKSREKRKRNPLENEWGSKGNQRKSTELNKFYDGFLMYCSLIFNGIQKKSTGNLNSPWKIIRKSIDHRRKFRRNPYRSQWKYIGIPLIINWTSIRILVNIK